MNARLFSAVSFFMLLGACSKAPQETVPSATATAAANGAASANGNAAPSSPPSAPAAAPSAPLAGAEASNSADLTHYPDEAALANEEAKIKALTIDARTAVDEPGAKPQRVATLKSGTKVTKVARHGDGFLVLFTEKGETTKRKAGWVDKAAFDPPMFGTHVLPICPKGQFVSSYAASPFEPHCTTTCKSDADCPKHVCQAEMDVTGATKSKDGFAKFCADTRGEN